MRKPRPIITLVGAGNIAQSLAPALARAGYKIDAVLARSSPASRRRARSLAQRVGAQSGVIGDTIVDASITCICVSDDAVPAVAATLARQPGWKGRVVLHFSGALSSDELAALRRRGASVGSLHPMMTFVSGVESSFHNVPFAVEGDATAVRAARRIARELGGDAFRIRKESKPLYHAVGSFSSPMIVATLATAERIAGAAGIPPARTMAIIAPILRRTVDNYLRTGAAAAFSGPIRRGDSATIHKHLTALKKVPAAHDVYVALTRSALRSIPVRDRTGVERLLDHDDPARAKARVGQKQRA